MYGIWNLEGVILYHVATEKWLLSRYCRTLGDDGYWAHTWTQPAEVSPSLGLAWYRRGKRIGKISVARQEDDE